MSLEWFRSPKHRRTVQMASCHIGFRIFQVPDRNRSNRARTAPMLFLRPLQSTSGLASYWKCGSTRLPYQTDKAMRIARYWILFLGQTLGDATILSHLIGVPHETENNVRLGVPRIIRPKKTLQDGPGSTFLSDPLSGEHPAFLAIEGRLGNSPRSSINAKTQQKSDFVNANRRSVRDHDRRICR